MGTFSPPVRLTVAGLPALLLASVVFAQTAPASAPALNAAAPSAARGATLAASCAGCHGPSGRAPDLTGRPAAQTQAALVAYRSGARRHPVMQGVAARLSDQDIVDLAAHYAQAGAPPTAPVPTPPPSTPPATTTPAAAATRWRGARRCTWRVPRPATSWPARCATARTARGPRPWAFPASPGWAKRPPWRP
ncbi:c-type cytochrome [Deinococcus multiflagellatus]|uniref:C-type cytochrome n=1 Tax=Deinococcus multiflagellatus TaxID=1656887 RepID=A0ABW1ZEP0_9DEIO